MGRRVLSIDIGLLKTRICEMEYGKKNPRIYKCITFDTPENAMEDGYIRDKEALAVVMKEHLAASKIRVTDVVFTIASSKIANREVVLPLVKEKRIQAVVDAGAQDYFPVDVSEYIISYSILERIDTKEDKKLKLLLLAAPNNMIKNYYSFAEMMNFSIIALDYIGNSAFQILKRQVEKGVNLSIQINEQTTLINVIDNEVLVLQRTIPYGILSVTEAVMENNAFGVNSDTEAISVLCQTQLINSHFKTENEEAAATLSQMSEHYLHNLQETRGREEVTESLHYLVSNIIRVLDYYNSKFQDKKVQIIYITGQGANFKGIDRLIENEIGLETKRIEQLYSVTFDKKAATENLIQSDYICAVGAAISPIGFVSKEILAREARKSSQVSTAFIFVLSLILSVVMIVISTLQLNAVKQDEKNLEAKIESLLFVETVYEEHTMAEEEYHNLAAMYSMASNKNEHLNELITALEDNLPSSMVVSSLAVNGTSITMNISANTKISVAKMLLMFKEIDLITDVSIASISETQDDNGITTVSFSVNCQYSN